MIRGIIGWSLKFRFVAVILALALMVVGVVQLRSTPVDVLPEFSPPYVEIQTEALGLSAEEVDQLVTLGLEQDLLNGVPWLDTIRSESVPGLSSIVLIFKTGTDLNKARQMVSERLTQAFALPHVSKPPTMLQPLSAASRVMLVRLSSKTLSMIQMSVQARWTIAPRLMGVPGVANVAIWGQRDRQLQVLVDPKRLQDQKVSLLQVLETAGNALWVSSLSFVEASTPGTGGFIDTANQRISIRHILPIVSPEGLAQVPIEGASAKLGDVANIVEDHQPLIGDALGPDGPSLLLVVEKFPGANTLDVSSGVEGALAKISTGLPGIDIDSSLYRPADFIRAAIDNLTLTLVIIGVLVMLVVAAFLLNWRTFLVSLASLVVSLFAGAVVLTLMGAAINVMVAAGVAVALGVLIDDSIVDVQHVTSYVRQLRQEGSPKSTATIIYEAASQMRSTLFYTTLILVLAVAPVFFVQGSTGAFFQPLVAAYGVMVIASMVVALVVTPGLCLIFLGNTATEATAPVDPPLVRFLQQRFTPMLTQIIWRPQLAVALAVVIGLAGLAALPFLKPSLVPQFKERSLTVQLNAAPGTSQSEMTRISGLISRDLRAIPGVRDIGAQVGRAVMGDQVVNVSSSQLWLSLDPAASYDATTAAISNVLTAYPGIHHSLQSYLQDKTAGIAEQATNKVTVRVYGDTADELQGQAENVKKALDGVGGISALNVKSHVQQPTLEITVDLAAAQKYGLKPGDVRRSAATLLSGIQVGNLFEDQKVFDVVVWSTPETRQSVSSILDLLIDTPDGKNVRLGDVAKVAIVPKASVIRHEAVKLYTDVVADVNGRSLDAVAADMSSRLKQMQFPLEYHAEVMGDFGAQQTQQTRLIASALVALAGIFFLLQAAFASWRLAVFTVLSMVVALAGGVLMVAITGGVLSLGALVGLLAVFGIALRNQLLLFSHYRHMPVPEGETFGVTQALRATNDRLVPILMTTVALALAMVLTRIRGDIPGLEIVRPMSLVIVGGLISSSLVNLLIAPALYVRLKVGSVEELDLPTAGQQEDTDIFAGLAQTPAPAPSPSVAIGN